MNTPFPHILSIHPINLPFQHSNPPLIFTQSFHCITDVGDPLATSKVLTMENFARQKSEMGQFLPLYKQVLNKAASLIWKSKDRQ